MWNILQKVETNFLALLDRDTNHIRYTCDITIGSCNMLHLQ